MDHLTIYTYGGGEILQKIFNLVAALCGSQSDFGMAIGMATKMGLIVSLIMGITRMQLASVARQWLIPALLTMLLFTVGSQKVIIYDFMVTKDVKQKTYSVNNVPLLLAYTAHFFSGVSQGMTKAIERAAHPVDDQTYNWTGHIWAGKSLFNTRKIKIIDGTTQENFRNFCKECVFRDLGLGIYTKKELEEAPNLLQFLSNRTSKIRHMNYRMEEGGKTFPISCRKAIQKIKQNLGNQIADSKEILTGAIGSETQFLIDKSANAPIQKLIEQQIAIDTLKNYTAGRYDTLASRRAEQYQIESQKILGAMGANMLLASRNYFEALLYGIFPFVMIMGLISFGFKVILGWIQLIAWISFWPPCFVLANFILDSIWEAKRNSWGLSSKTYTITMSDGLFDLYNHMEAIACGIFLTIPLLSWGLLYLSKGGASALVHWASNFTGAAQSAASMAANEEISGNYNYRNVGLGGQNIGNITNYQRSMSPTYRHGILSTQDSQGTITTSLEGGFLTLDQRKSHLTKDIAGSEVFSHIVQKNLREGEALLETDSSSFSENVGHTVNTLQGINKHTANASTLSAGWDESNLANIQNQAQEVFSKAEEYGKTHNMDSSQVFDESIRIGLSGGFLLKGGLEEHNAQKYGESQVDQGSQRHADALSIFEGVQSLAQTISREGGSISSEESLRGYRDFSESFNKAASFADQLSVAYTRQKNLEDLNSAIQTNDLKVTESLNNQFVHHLSQKYEDRERIEKALNDPQELQDFAQNYIPERVITSPNLQQKYTEERAKMVEKTGGWTQDIQSAEIENNQLKGRITPNLSLSNEAPFSSKENLEKLQKIKKENLEKFDPSGPLKEHYESIQKKAQRLGPHKMDGSENPGEFQERKKDFLEKANKSFFSKAIEKSSVVNLAKDTATTLGRVLGTRDLELPDNLTEDQKIALVDARYED